MALGGYDKGTLGESPSQPTWSHRWQAQGTWQSPSARDAHMLLQNELFLNVATKDWVEGELRGQIISLPYSGLLARYTGTWGAPRVVTGGGGASPHLPPPMAPVYAQRCLWHWRGSWCPPR